MSKIIGIGTDIVKHARIERIITSPYSKRFIVKVLNPFEISEFEKKSDLKSKTSYLSSRWCYKEALVKASGRKDLTFSQIYLNKSENGKPYVILEELSQKILNEEVGAKHIHLSISHEDDYSISFVVLEA